MLKRTTQFALAALVSVPALAVDHLCKNTETELAARPAMLKLETRMPEPGMLVASTLLHENALFASAKGAGSIGLSRSDGIALYKFSGPGSEASASAAARDRFKAGGAGVTLPAGAAGQASATVPRLDLNALALKSTLSADRPVVSGKPFVALESRTSVFAVDLPQAGSTGQIDALRRLLPRTRADHLGPADIRWLREYLAETYRKKFDMSDIDKHTPPKDDLQASLKGLPKPVPGSPMAKFIAATIPTGGELDCTGEVTGPWRDAETALRNASHGAVYAPVVTMMANPELYRKVSPGMFVLVQEYVTQARKVLQACYMPAETSGFVKRHTLMQQLGTLATAGTPFCTAMAFGAPNYVLTARHCFAHVTKDSGAMWYVPAAGNDRYQVCGIAGDGALDKAQFGDIARDQVLVRVAAGGVAPAKVAVLNDSKLLTVRDYTRSDSPGPTLLRGISYFPLANVLLPQTYRTGFVQGSMGICAAASKDDGCFVHTCAAIAGGSGSPVFVDSDQQLILAGTHVGQSNSVGQACKSQYNAAVPIDPGYSALEFVASPITNP